MGAIGAGGAARPGRALRSGMLACLVMALAALLSLAPYVTSGTELVRLRNALSLADDLPPDFDWQPPQQPGHGFVHETAAAPAFFVDIARGLRLSDMPDDRQRAMAIIQHLLAKAPPLVGGALHADLRTTYERITRNGEGYCGDFVRVFHAIAHAAGMTTRSWAFSFDGFGGHGHVWPEFWNRQRQQWELIGPFMNLYFALEDREPLSALRVRQALLENDPGLHLHKVIPGEPMGFDTEERAFNYVRRGIDQWYLLWGDGVHTYDQAPGIQSLSKVSRALENLAGIAQGVQPPIRILPTPTNRVMADQLRRLRVQVLMAAAVVPASLLVALVLFWRLRRRAP